MRFCLLLFVFITAVVSTLSEFLRKLLECFPEFFDHYSLIVNNNNYDIRPAEIREFSFNGTDAKVIDCALSAMTKGICVSFLPRPDPYEDDEYYSDESELSYLPGDACGPIFYQLNIDKIEKFSEPLNCHNLNVNSIFKKYS